MNTILCTTRPIEHLAHSSDFTGVTFYIYSNGLTGNRFDMSGISYTCLSGAMRG